MNEINFFTADAMNIEINIREAARYIGIGSKGNPELYYTTIAELERLSGEVRQVLAPKACYVFLPLEISEEMVQIGNFHLKSRALAINLKECGSVCIFAATLGHDIDRLIGKYARMHPAKGVMCDALASAAVEGLCDSVDAAIAGESSVRPRFSPGYGDLDLAVQRDITSLLKAEKMIGLTLTESLQMTPTKSVTAFVGVLNVEIKRNKHENT